MLEIHVMRVSLMCIVTIACPAGWTAGGNQCFMRNLGRRTYDNSVKYCKSLGANIASIHNKQENDVVLSLATQSYIGAESDGKGKWKWNDGTPWWQPNYEGTDGIYGFQETRIVVLTDRKWHDWGKGETLFSVICSQPGEVITITSMYACMSVYLCMLYACMYVCVRMYACIHV